jgi:ankyrin repeat protein
MGGGYTALAMATRLGKTQMVELLLEAGADVNAATKRDGAPLVLAVRASFELAKTLLANVPTPMRGI